MAAQTHSQPEGDREPFDGSPVLDVHLPELELTALSERRGYGVYATVAAALVLIPVVSSGLLHLSDGTRLLVVVALCAVLGAAFILVAKGMRQTLRLERAAQERFLSVLASRHLSPLEATEIAQRPDSLVLTDGDELSLWEAEYSGDAATLRRVRPTPVA